MSIQASYVEPGSDLIETCPDCADERVVTVIYALTADGPVSLGTLVTCDGCGQSFRCRFCVAVIEQDGALIHDHFVAHPNG